MVFDGFELLEFAINSVRKHVDYVSVVWQNLSYWGNTAPPELYETVKRLADCGLVDEMFHYDCDLSLPPKQNELNIRNFGLHKAVSQGCTHHITADVDDFYIPEQFAYAKTQMGGHDCSIISTETYYKQPTYKIVPNQKHTQTFIHPVDNVYSINADFKFKIETTKRHVRCDNPRIFSRDEIVLHHMSYVRKDFDRKIQNNGNYIWHRDQKTVTEFDTYQLGDRIRVAPDFMNRRTVLVENTFGIHF